MVIKKIIIDGGKAAAKQLAPDVADEVVQLGVKLGNEVIDKQMSLVKLPDLKDVKIDEAVRILRDELSFSPVPILSKPSADFSESRADEVVYSEPRFGSRISPNSTVKIYYVTDKIIEESKKLAEKQTKEFKCPDVVGVKILEARNDLEYLGLRVNEKIEKPSPDFADKEDGQVTRLTNPNDQKLPAKLKTGDRVIIHYVTDEVILDSQLLKNQLESSKQERFDKLKGAAKGVFQGINQGVTQSSQNAAELVKKPFQKRRK